MTGWLLDTNILSELRRPKPERKVLAFIAVQPLDLLYISSATLAEIRFGIELLSDASRRAGLNDWLAHKMRPMFDGTRPRNHRRRPVQMAASGRRWPQGRSHLLAARSHHRRNGTASRPDRGVPRPQRLSKSVCAGVQSVGRSATRKLSMTGAIVPLISVPSGRQSHGEFSAMDRNTRWVSQGLNPSYELISVPRKIWQLARISEFRANFGDSALNCRGSMDRLSALSP